MTGSSISLGRYSLGVGDRFEQEAEAQLLAFKKAEDLGVVVVPVWNKSIREHGAIGTQPVNVRMLSDQAVAAVHWDHAYLVDADHITHDTVGPYIDPCDFFTLDVAEQIGVPAEATQVDAFVDRHPELVGPPSMKGLGGVPAMSEPELRETVGRYLSAVREARRIYDKIATGRGVGTFHTEVSMDETPKPQMPVELLVILAALADEGVPVQTIAPRFSGRFNKGINYRGDTDLFEKEFTADALVVVHAIERYGLPADLKLSVHSGSDKFLIFPIIHRVTRALNIGVHVKTAGTTWLEEVIGLAEAGGDGLALVEDIYADSYERRVELCAPYPEVIDIDVARLPSVDEVRGWSGAQFAAAVRHDESNPAYSDDMRQLVHVGFRVAAGMGDRYTSMLREYHDQVAPHVTHNIFERHLKPLFLGP